MEYFCIAVYITTSINGYAALVSKLIIIIWPMSENHSCVKSLYYPVKICRKMGLSKLALIKIIRMPLFRKATMKIILFTWINSSVKVGGCS